MHVLFYFERQPLLFQHQAKGYIQRFVVFRKRRVVVVLHKTACKWAVFFLIHACCHERRVEFFYVVKLPGAVNHRLAVAVPVEQQERGYAVGLGHTVVVGAERRRYMYDACAVFGGHEIAAHHAERAFAGVHPGDKLLIRPSGKGCTLILHRAFQRESVAFGRFFR